MFETIDDIQITFEDDGVETVRQLDKVVLSKGSWTTIIFKYQDYNRQKEMYNPVKFSIRRYKKANNVYREQSKFNISSINQAQQLIEVLNKWIAEGEPEG